jgi:hypothetical protein
MDYEVSKEQILADVREGLRTGVITEAEVRAVFVKPLEAEPQGKEPETKPDKLSAVDVMFYIAGIVLFAAIVSVIVQSWNGGSAVGHILLSAGVGAALWALASYLIKSPRQSDLRRGLINSSLLTGSLSVIAGGYIITNEIIGGFNELNLIAGSFTLFILGLVHMGFDRVVKKNLILLMGVLLAAASFPSLVFGIVKQNMTVDIWSFILVLTALLLAYSTRVVAKIYPDRPKIHNAFDGFAAFVALLSMYISSYGEFGVVWLIALISSVFGIFYLSIVMQNKDLLGNGSFFLVLTVITISFKYFSGYGVATSLIMATFGLLGSAAVASTINKKYFKPAGKPDVK